MWASLCNFLYGKLFYKPEVKAPPSSNDSTIDPVYGKRVKLSHPGFDTSDLLTNSSQTPQRFAMQAKKYLTNGDDEDECCVIAEIYKAKTAESSSTIVSARVSVIKKGSSVRDDLPLPSSSQRQVLQMRDESKDTQVSKSKTSSERDNPTPNRSHKIFTTQRASLSHSKAARTRVIYKHHLKRNLNSLEQSYRLKEKYQYMKLLQSHTSYHHDFLPATPSDIHHVEEQVEPLTIPIIDLTGEGDGENNDDSQGDMRPTPNLPVVRRESTLEEDPDVQFILEVPGVRSFEDIIRTRPVDCNESSQDMLTNLPGNSSGVPNRVDSEQEAVILIDDEDEEGEQSFGEDLEETLRKYMLITDPPEETVENQSEEPCLPDLTPEQEKKFDEAIGPGPCQQVLVQGFGLRITKRDITTLSEFNWLNDEIINFYLQLIMDRSKRNRSLPKVYAFNTFFYSKLAASGHTGLRRWTKTVDLFSFDLIFIPVHLGFHWCLSAIDFRRKSIKYYDSIGTPNDLCLERLLHYIKNESLDKRNQVLSMSDWVKSNVVDIPQQMNGSDCGVFVCMFAEHLARNRNFSFTQDNMPYFRKKIGVEILQKKLLT